MAITRQTGAGGFGDAAEPFRLFELWPHRSLDRCGLLAVHGAVIAAFLVVIARSAGPALWPIAVACMLTYLVLATAFWVNGRSARMAERIEIRPGRVTILRYGPAAEPLFAEFNTHWVRIAVSQSREAANRITFSESGRSVSIGEFLSHEERLELAASLRHELDRMRRAR